MKKTNALRILDSNSISYDVLNYDENIEIDGLNIAKLNNIEENLVYKTLVTVSSSKEVFVFLIPVKNELDLKKAAKASGEKKIEMVPLKDLLKLTGYIRGGCSPIGMKKQYPTFIDNSAAKKGEFYINGGKKGTMIRVNPNEIKELINGVYYDLIKGERI